MRISIQPGRLQGTICAPPSKSIAHRALICAALAGQGTVINVGDSKDIQATLSALALLGVSAQQEGGSVIVSQEEATAQKADCKESGSTLRFMVPLSLLRGGADFTGCGRLLQRPMEEYWRAFAPYGVTHKLEDGILAVRGRLQAGEYRLNGDVSSQFVSGLLFALPLLQGESRITLTSPLQSKSYVELTLEVLAAYGVRVQEDENGYRVPGAQRYAHRGYCVEGDYSQAAFWLCAGALGGDVRVRELNKSSTQGDKAIIKILSRMGAQLEETASFVHCTGDGLKGIEIDASDIPDLVPALAAVAATAQGCTRITQVERLRYKESDRLDAVTKELNALGARIENTGNSLLVYGVHSLQGGLVKSWNDHRIVMALSIAALSAEAPVVIENYTCVDKSYPQFFTDFKTLGGHCETREE